MHPQVQAAIDAANAGDKAQAFELINQLLVQDARNVEAWLMLAALTEDEESKVKYLQRVLVLEPQNQIAREELIELKRMVPPPPVTPKATNARQAAPPSLVQAAIDAIKAGNKPQALEYLRQRLQENPNDVEVWLVMPALVDDLARKRQYLQVALGIDPNNKIARERLTEVERAGALAAPPSYVNQTATPTLAATYTTQTVTPPAASAPAKQATPQVYKFTYPIVMKFIIYAMLVGALIFLVSGLAGQMGEYCWPLSFVVVAGAWVVSVRVEIDASEVRVVQFFIRKVLKWDDITSMRAGVQRYHLQLTDSGGRSLKINSQLEGYETLLGLIRQRRPDLFSDMSGTDKTFSDYRVFKKSLVKYVVVVFGVILVLLGVPVFWAPTTNDRIGFLLLITFGLYLIIAPLLGVRQVKVEPGILTLDWLFRNEEYRPHHIEKIYLENIRGRYGAVHHYVVIKPQDEKMIQLNDFGRDTDLLYGVLMNWWKSGRK